MSEALMGGDQSRCFLTGLKSVSFVFLLFPDTWPNSISIQFTFWYLIVSTPTRRAIKTSPPKQPLREKMQLILKVKFSLTRAAATQSFL